MARPDAGARMTKHTHAPDLACTAPHHHV
ncbi:transcriptional repressor, partial [Xanthomonas oryzae pv. oryzae]